MDVIDEARAREMAREAYRIAWWGIDHKESEERTVASIASRLVELDLLTERDAARRDAYREAERAFGLKLVAMLDEVSANTERDMVGNTSTPLALGLFAMVKTMILVMISKDDDRRATTAPRGETGAE